jgi:indole-3-glycerol phosphate synthase
MSDILQRILARKAEEVSTRRGRQPLADLKSRCRDSGPARGFARAIQSRAAAGMPAVIAEIKKASPSKGLLRDPFAPAAIAQSYQRGGASCLSVLTDAGFFQGHEDDLLAARAACGLPVLRKDFTVDPWQLFEGRALGADAILLIVAALEPRQLEDLALQALELGLDVLVEVHDAAELEIALSPALDSCLLGINNRNLKTFATTLETTFDLLARIGKDRLKVSESGIGSAEDIRRLRAAGVEAFLIGETFMRADDPGLALAALLA